MEPALEGAWAAAGAPAPAGTTSVGHEAAAGGDGLGGRLLGSVLRALGGDGTEEEEEKDDSDPLVEL